MCDENQTIDRSRRLEVFCKKGALRNFAKFTRKHLRQSLFFNKVAGFRQRVCKSPANEIVVGLLSFLIV